MNDATRPLHEQLTSFRSTRPSRRAFRHGRAGTETHHPPLIGFLLTLIQLTMYEAKLRSKRYHHIY